MKPTAAMLEAGGALVGSRELAGRVWLAMWLARERADNPKIALAELDVLGGASVASVRRRYGLSGSVVQRLMRLAKGD